MVSAAPTPSQGPRCSPDEAAAAPTMATGQAVTTVVRSGAPSPHQRTSTRSAAYCTDATTEDGISACASVPRPYDAQAIEDTSPTPAAVAETPAASRVRRSRRSCGTRNPVLMTVATRANIPSTGPHFPGDPSRHPLTRGMGVLEVGRVLEGGETGASQLHDAGRVVERARHVGLAVDLRHDDHVDQIAGCVGAELVDDPPAPLVLVEAL